MTPRNNQKPEFLIDSDELREAACDQLHPFATQNVSTIRQTIIALLTKLWLLK